MFLHRERSISTTRRVKMRVHRQRISAKILLVVVNKSNKDTQMPPPIFAVASKAELS